MLSEKHLEAHSLVQWKNPTLICIPFLNTEVTPCFETNIFVIKTTTISPCSMSVGYSTDFDAHRSLLHGNCVKFLFNQICYVAEDFSEKTKKISTTWLQSSIVTAAFSWEETIGCEWAKNDASFISWMTISETQSTAQWCTFFIHPYQFVPSTESHGFSAKTINRRESSSLRRGAWEECCVCAMVSAKKNFFTATVKWYLADLMKIKPVKSLKYSEFTWNTHL